MSSLPVRFLERTILPDSWSELTCQGAINRRCSTSYTMWVSWYWPLGVIGTCVGNTKRIDAPLSPYRSLPNLPVTLTWIGSIYHPKKSGRRRLLVRRDRPRAHSIEFWLSIVSAEGVDGLEEAAALVVVFALLFDHVPFAAPVVRRPARRVDRHHVRVLRLL